MNVRVRARDFRPGDVLPTGSTVVGVFGFVRGGVKVDLLDADGRSRTAVINGRYVHDVTRPES